MHFSADGALALIPVLDQATLLADLATGTVRRLDVAPGGGTLSPDGRQVEWIRRRPPCRLMVLDVASGQSRRVSRVGCGSQSWWGPRGIVHAREDRSGTHVGVIDPATGTRRPLLSLPRVLKLAGASPSGAWRIVALADDRVPPAAVLALADGRRVVRPLGPIVGDPVFTADDQAVLVVRPSGAVVRIELATGARRRVGATDGGVSTG